jgi:hypothetical protein
MKTQRKSSRRPYLPTRNNRWKWMAGATAAGMTASQAGAITINLANNYISATGGNHLNADLTGDGHPDITIANPFFSRVYAFTSPGIPNAYYARYWARANVNGIQAYGWADNDGGVGEVILGLQAKGFYGLYSQIWSASLTGTIPIFFKDLHINGGAPTEGSLEVTVSAGGRAEIQLDSFTYQGSSPTILDRGSIDSIPDGGSTLALLALGAGGVVSLRRWRATRSGKLPLSAQFP